MATKSKYLGHDIEWINGEWFFCETGCRVSATWGKMSCGYCGKNRTVEGHDGCLGTLPGVMNACCGHGQPSEAYIQFLDGISIHGRSAIIILMELKKAEPDFMASIGTQMEIINPDALEIIKNKTGIKNDQNTKNDNLVNVMPTA